MNPRPPITVRPGTAADRPMVAGILARAFIDDPAFGYIFPDATARAMRLQRFFALITAIAPDPALTDIALDEQGHPVAVALWRSPGAWATPATTMLRRIGGLVTTFGTALPRALALQAVLDSHHPAAPHWYLQFAGCLPQAQGRGYGGAVIRARLAQCDVVRLPAGLETATPANVPLYTALGFTVAEQFDIPRGGPAFWTMWREPR